MSGRPVRPGATTLALLGILVITAAWWALALWPAGGPEWLERTRAACFGSVPNGLPSTGGWILLIGQPLGMLGFLMVAWGGTLRTELRRLAVMPGWRIGGYALAACLMAAGWGVTRRVTTAKRLGTVETGPGILSRIRLVPPPLELTDQYGWRRALAESVTGSALVGFAYGHCETVCPTLVHALRAARSAAGRPDLPILIVSLDPWRDTPERLPHLARQWGLERKDLVLSGSVETVSQTLDRLGIGRRRDESSGEIVHGETVFLLENGILRWRLEGGGGMRRLLAQLNPAGE